MSQFKVGVDVGGTFTDTVMVTDEGAIARVKVPSTPPDFYEGLLNGIARLRRPLKDMELLAHGTTVGLNAILARRGARTALVTTRGYRDTLAIRRGDRADQFNLWWQPQKELIPRSARYEIDERINYAGAVVRPLDGDDVERVVTALAEEQFDAIGIVFINSFVNRAHEEAVASRLRGAFPNTYICASYEILPEILEYERTSTTVLNAYIGPVVSKYVAQLEARLAEGGYGGPIVIATSAGGVATPDMVRRIPARTVESGPAAGVMAARAMAAEAGYPNVVAFDMGGTSLDLGIVHKGDVRRSHEYEVEWRTPIRFPCVDVFSIGAGGGSIAWIDAGGSLRCGPQSAGSRPGPACYGTGGEEPTTTDAQVVLGRLNPEAFLGGEMTIYPELAREAIDRVIGGPLGLTMEEAAAGILEIANNTILQSLRIATVERGYDPREFALFAFGGAGPLYAAEVAREGSISSVLVPRYPGLTSALGLLMIDIRHDVSRSVMLPEDAAEPDVLNNVFDELEEDVLKLLAAEGAVQTSLVTHREADLRYFGQSESLYVSVPSGALTSDALSNVFEGFREKQLREFGYLMPEDVARIEIVTLRVVGLSQVVKPSLTLPTSTKRTSPPPRTRRPVVFHGSAVEADIYQRDDLSPGAQIEGPAIIEQSDSTTVAPPRSRVLVDGFGNLIITFDAP